MIMKAFKITNINEQEIELENGLKLTKLEQPEDSLRPFIFKGDEEAMILISLGYIIPKKKDIPQAGLWRHDVNTELYFRKEQADDEEFVAPLACYP